MYLLKDVEIKFEGLQKELAHKIGISECYLSKILNRKKKCSQLVAYAFVKALAPEKEIEDFFERCM